MKISHIINLVYIEDSTRNLYYAQPVTFETMRLAVEYSNKECEVELFTAQFCEDRKNMPNSFLNMEQDIK